MVSKHDLKIRSISHRLQGRVEAHITIYIVAYEIYKELERQHYQRNGNISGEQAIEIKYGTQGKV